MVRKRSRSVSRRGRGLSRPTKRRRSKSVGSKSSGTAMVIDSPSMDILPPRLIATHTYRGRKTVSGTLTGGQSEDTVGHIHLNMNDVDDPWASIGSGVATGVTQAANYYSHYKVLSFECIVRFHNNDVKPIYVGLRPQLGAAASSTSEVGDWMSAPRTQYRLMAGGGNYTTASQVAHNYKTHWTTVRYHSTMKRFAKATGVPWDEKFGAASGASPVSFCPLLIWFGSMMIPADNTLAPFVDIQFKQKVLWTEPLALGAATGALSNFPDVA